MPKSPRFSPSSIRVIEVLTFPAVKLLDVTGPVQVFASANDLVANAGGAPPYRLKLVTQGERGVVSSAGVMLAAGPLTRHRAAESGSGAASALGDAHAGQACRAALRLRLGGNDAPQLPAPARSYTARLPLSIHVLRFDAVQMDQHVSMA